MNKFDFTDLDGRLLRTFLIILEESSVSRAADRLDVTQSAVSHALAKLRRILGDPLFIRSGQGLTPTETALTLKEPIIAVLDGMKALTHKRRFDPRSEMLHFVVSANDMQRDLIFPRLLRDARADGIRLSFEFRPSGVPNVSLLREARCDLILTPLPPDGSDMFQHKLFSGRMMCFFDGSRTAPPTTVEDYLAAQHVGVRFALGGESNDVLAGPEVPRLPEATVTVSNFAGIPPFVKGTKLLTTQLEFMRETSLRGLDMAPLPFATDPVTIYMVWHERSTNDPAHRCLRQMILDAGRFIKSTF